ncbi:MAG TPA: ABC transporter substrate-binding protein [Alphaproteobacteria bacterium]|nr:ABC transporter substrate-binding protein [Alphaproteobacteria bacterium]
MVTLSMPTRDYGLMRQMKTVRRLNDDIEISYPKFTDILVAVRKMVRERPFDICEMPFTTYICAKEYGKKFTAIPVFITRNFHHWAIFASAKAGVAKPKDLEGKTVGVVRGYTVTTGVWARGMLAEEYGVDLDKVRWAATDDEHVAEFKLPPNVDYEFMGRDIKELLASGEVAAAVGAVTGDVPGVEPLIPDAVKAGFEFYRKTGIYPVNHGIVVRDELLERYPTLAADLFYALKASKDSYLLNLDRTGNLSAEDALTVRLEKGIGGDPFPYGVEPNRGGLEALTRYAYDQNITSRKYAVEELFAKGTLDLVG